MLFRKDRKIKNQEAMIRNRDILIGDMEEEVDVIYEEKKDFMVENAELKEQLDRIKKLVTSNAYNNEKIILNKIKELISDFDTQN